MQSAMDFPAIRNFLSGLLRRMPGVRAADFVGGKNDVATRDHARGLPEDSPFVLVAHGASGRWEVYARNFERPLASFDERQACCDFASNLAKTRENAIVLIRESKSME